MPTACYVSSTAGTVTDSNNVETVFRTQVASMFFAFDASGNATVNNLKENVKFQITKNGRTVSYAVTAGGLQATYGTTTKISKTFARGQQSSVPVSELDVDNDSIFVPAIISSDGTLTITTDVLKNMSSDVGYIVVDSSDFSKSYGTLTKNDADKCSLSRTSDNTLSFKKITIEDGVIVDFSSNFAGVAITVTNSGGNTSLTSATNIEFTLNNNGVASIYGAGGVFNLSRGTLRTSNSDQSIKAGAYTVSSGAGDGANFVVDKDGKVTIAHITSDDSDIISHNNLNYFAGEVGFIRENSVVAGRYSIWNNGDTGIHNHSLKGNSLTAEDLTKSANWDPAATVSAANKAATIPPFTFYNTVTLVGNDFVQTYGTLTRNEEVHSNYTLSKDAAEPKLSRISVGSVDELTFDEGLDNIRIDAAVASLIVTEEDSTPGYKVTLTSAVGETSAASVSGANRVSLISGTLQADKNIAVSVQDISHTTNLPACGAA